MQNEDGNTILHEGILGENVSLYEKLKQYIKILDDQIENKEGKTAPQIYNELKDEEFKELIAKKKQ